MRSLQETIDWMDRDGTGGYIFRDAFKEISDRLTALENINKEFNNPRIEDLQERVDALEDVVPESVTKLGTDASDLPFPQLLEVERKRFASVMEENVKLKMEIKGYQSASKDDEEELIARSNIINQKTKLIDELVEELSNLKEELNGKYSYKRLYQEIHSLLNDIAGLTPLTGSPDYKECLLWLKDNLPQIYILAGCNEYGRIMPINQVADECQCAHCTVCRETTQKQMEKLKTEHHILQEKIGFICSNLGIHPHADPLTKITELKADARLGRLVRSMPIDSELRHQRSNWYWRKDCDQRGLVRNTPEETLHAAGVTLTEEKTIRDIAVNCPLKCEKICRTSPCLDPTYKKEGAHSTDGFPADYSVNIGSIRPKEEL